MVCEGGEILFEKKANFSLSQKKKKGPELGKGLVLPQLLFPLKEEETWKRSSKRGGNTDEFFLISLTKNGEGKKGRV